MQIELDDDGNVWFVGLPPICADTLLQLPATLASEDPAVRARLLPETFTDPEEEAQWRRLGRPELEHLFASRLELVRTDLASLEEDGELGFRLRIRREHRAAWSSALNAARLTLFIEQGLSEEDMEAEPGELDDFPRDLALLRIHLLGYMQELLITSA